MFWILTIRGGLVSLPLVTHPPLGTNWGLLPWEPRFCILVVLVQSMMAWTQLRKVLISHGSMMSTFLTQRLSAGVNPLSVFLVVRRPELHLGCAQWGQNLSSLADETANAGEMICTSLTQKPFSGANQPPQAVSLLQDPSTPARLSARGLLCLAEEGLRMSTSMMSMFLTQKPW